jgi:Leucine-rich repeat (LRR) protein
MMTKRRERTKKPSPLVRINGDYLVELEDVLALYPEARTARIRGLYIDDIDLSHIALPSLFTLAIEETSLTDINLEPLSACDWLGFLHIDHNRKLKSMDLSPFSACKKLRDLYMRDNSFDDIDFSQLGDCKKLIRLDIANNPSRRLSLDGIEKIRNLSSLSLGPQDNLGLEEWTIDLSPLFECQNLRILYLPEFHVRVLIDGKYRDAYESGKWTMPGFKGVVEFY